jgi:hypothetical protein
MGSQDVASITNADILAGILDVPLLPELGAKNSKIAVEMKSYFGGFRAGVSVNQRDTSVNKRYTNWSRLGSLPR